MQQESRICFKIGRPGIFTLLPYGGATLDGKQKYTPPPYQYRVNHEMVLNYARSSGKQLRIICVGTVFKINLICTVDVEFLDFLVLSRFVKCRYIWRSCQPCNEVVPLFQ
jgi:hypothetical protein